jgi:hypothetical protein
MRYRSAKVKYLSLVIGLLLPLNWAESAGVRRGSPVTSDRALASKRVPKKGSRAIASVLPDRGSGGPKEIDRPLQVSGQTRSLNMLLTLKNANDEIGFVDKRKNFKDKIPSTRY